MLRVQLDELLFNPNELQANWTGVSAPMGVSAQQIRYILKSRAARASIIGEDLFADPAWDILLDLYAAHLTGETVSVSSACIAANVPYTTALRWTNALEARGLILRQNDPDDGRRTYVSLAPKAILAVEEYFKHFALPV